MTTFLPLESIGVFEPRKKADDASSGIPPLPIGDHALGLLDAMIKRRHHIVHRADKANTGGGLQEVTESDVMSWLATTMMFTLSIATENFRQRHSQEHFQKSVTAWAAAAAKSKGPTPRPVPEEGA